MPPTGCYTSNPCFLSDPRLPVPSLTLFRPHLPPCCSFNTTVRILLQGLCTCCFLCLRQYYPRYPEAHFLNLSGLCCSDVPSLERPSLTTELWKSCFCPSLPPHPAFICPHSTSCKLPFCPITHSVWINFPSPSLGHLLHKGRDLGIFPGNLPSAQNGAWHAVGASQLPAEVSF